MLFIVSLAVFLVGTLAQDATEVETLCADPVNYIAHSFNTLRFSNAVSYHDVANYTTLYEESEDVWFLYDYTAGTVYGYQSGNCFYIYEEDAKINVLGRATLLDDLDIKWDSKNFGGSAAIGYSVVNGGVEIRGVFRLDDCLEAFSYIAVDGIPYTAVTHSDFITDNVEDTIQAKIGAARAVIDSGICAEIDLSAMSDDDDDDAAPTRAGRQGRKGNKKQQ